jgi:hypothetical protein
MNRQVDAAGHGCIQSLSKRRRGWTVVLLNLVFVTVMAVLVWALLLEGRKR